MTRGFARMDAKQDSSEICVTRNAGSAQKAVTGQWVIVLKIVQSEDLGNCVKGHAI